MKLNFELLFILPIATAIRNSCDQVYKLLRRFCVM